MIYAVVEKDFGGGYTPLVKIGYVTGVEYDDAFAMLRKRLGKLQAGNPRRLVCVGFTQGTQADEKALHYRFQDARIKRPAACEWLRVTQDVAAWMESVRVEPIEFSQKVGVGARGGRAPAPKKKNACSGCGSTDHTRPRCAVFPQHKAQPLWSPRGQRSIDVNGRPALKRGEWMWRGKVRTSWASTESTRWRLAGSARR